MSSAAAAALLGATASSLAGATASSFSKYLGITSDQVSPLTMRAAGRAVAGRAAAGSEQRHGRER